MSELTKLKIKSVVKTNKQDPAIQRRRKLALAIDLQINVVATALDGKHYEVERSTWVRDGDGEKQLVARMRRVRPWFFEQDGGWYVQLRYGNKVLELGNGNAAFVKSLTDVQGVLEKFKQAANSGELDDSLARASKSSKSS